MGATRLGGVVCTAASPKPALNAPHLLRVLLIFWFITSVASLFAAKHALHISSLSPPAFAAALFLTSATAGVVATRGFRLAPLAPLTRTQARIVLPLALAHLVKEVLKYAAIARVSVNLINTARALGPAITLLLEYLLFASSPSRRLLVALVPTVAGVALTGLDELSLARAPGSATVFLVGAAAAVASTVINQGQNMYSKRVFTTALVDPISLQIHLSLLSFVLLLPALAFAPPAPLSPSAVAAVVSAGLLNFLASQLAFATLAHISPVSYSVANTFKRVVTSAVAFTVLGEHMSPTNCAGIAVSVGGVYYYERAARDVKAGRIYDATRVEVKDSADAAHRHPSQVNRKSATSPQVHDIGARGDDLPIAPPPEDIPCFDVRDTVLVATSAGLAAPSG